MQKKIVILLMGTLLTCALFGCGKKEVKPITIEPTEDVFATEQEKEPENEKPDTQEVVEDTPSLPESQTEEDTTLSDEITEQNESSTEIEEDKEVLDSIIPLKSGDTPFLWGYFTWDDSNCDVFYEKVPTIDDGNCNLDFAITAFTDTETNKTLFALELTDLQFHNSIEPDILTTWTYYNCLYSSDDRQFDVTISIGEEEIEKNKEKERFPELKKYPLYDGYMLCDISSENHLLTKFSGISNEYVILTPTTTGGLWSSNFASEMSLEEVGEFIKTHNIRYHLTDEGKAFIKEMISVDSDF